MSEPPRSGGGKTGAAVEIAFSLRDPTYPFVGASAVEDCRVELAKLVPRSDGEYAEFFNVVDADPARIERLAAEYDAVEISRLRTYERGGLFEFLVSGDCPAVTLAEHGALPSTVLGVEGDGRVVAEVPAERDVSGVIEAFLDEYSEAELVRRRNLEAVSPMFSRSCFQEVLHDQLTERQLEVLETAFEAGYYDWPRETKGREVADRLDITSATFSEHVHAAERKLVAILFADRER